jgi:branched-chain amino acid transport system ATP-binding protein
MAELLAVEGLTAGYGDATVLEDVALALDEGDSLALLGRNGMGKTTLLVTLMGLTRMRKGTLRWRGSDLAALPTHRRSRIGIGWVPQERYMLPSLTVEEHLTAVARPGRGTSRAFTRLSRASKNGARISATSFPAASSRCWRSPAR